MKIINSYKKNIDKTNFFIKKQNINKSILQRLKEENIIKDFFYEDDFILINGECIHVMKELIKSNILVDHIITDIPYGTVQGLSIDGWKKKRNIPKWDIPINNDDLLYNSFYLTKPNSNLILFSQEPLTSSLLLSINNFQKYILSNKLIWVKNNHANSFNAKRTPLNYYEEILLIRKSLDETNSIEIREYFKYLFDNIKDSKKQILEKIGQGVDHCFRFSNRTFYLPTLENYKKLIKEYEINKLEKFIPYYQLKEKWDNENNIIFNIPKNQKIVKNVLNFDKDKKNIHPTQKPIKLLKTLIEIFSNKGEWILDFTSGSGSTGIACISSKRKFIGIELDTNYYKKSIEWYKQIKLNK